MTYQSSLPCSFKLLAAALVVVLSASVMTLADASDEEFRLLEVRCLQSRSSWRVMVKFQGPPPTSFALLHPEGSIKIDDNEVIAGGSSQGKDVTIRMKWQDIIYTVVTNELEVPIRVRGQRPKRYTNESQAIPDVSMTLPGLTTYSAGDDVTFNVEVTTGDVARSAIVGEELTFENYVRVSDKFFYPGPEGLLSETDRTEEEGSTTYQVALDTAEEPRGLAIVKGSVQFSPDASKLVKSVKVEKMTEFYSTEKGSSLASGALMFFRMSGEMYKWNWRTVMCDTSLPDCDVACTVISKDPLDELWMIGGRSYRHLAVKNDTTFGVITTITNTTNDLRDYFTCGAKAAGSSELEEQVIDVKSWQPTRMLPDISAAEMHANQTLEVRCAARGTPTPELSVVADDDPNTSLADRFPSESFPRVAQVFRDARLRYTLNKPSFTSTLTHVTCVASNGYGDPVKTVLQITPAA